MSKSPLELLQERQAAERAALEDAQAKALLLVEPLVSRAGKISRMREELDGELREYAKEHAAAVRGGVSVEDLKASGVPEPEVAPRQRRRVSRTSKGQGVPAGELQDTPA